jgi:hypothetical protein
VTVEMLEARRKNNKTTSGPGAVITLDFRF